MKKLLYLFAAAALCASCAATPAEIPAFPGAEGWGMYAKGGRGGKVIAVTNLNDDGPGSFRAAVMDTVPRIVVFRVSGTITLTQPLIITSPYLTIAGQTAPGDGICLRGFPFRVANTHDIVVRFIRFRPGIGSGLIGSEIDGLEVRHSERVIFDHCSVSWSSDEGINNWHGSRYNTFQWCIISEPLHYSVHEKGGHGFGASLGGYKTSFHHNAMAHTVARMPSIAGNAQHNTVLLDLRNNVFYNWESRGCDGKPHSINLVNNYYKPGPATREGVRRRVARIDNAEPRHGFIGIWHIEGNYVHGFSEISENNWNGGVDFEEGSSEELNRQLKPFDFAHVTTQPAQQAYELVLRYAGARVPNRDSQDERILAEIAAGTAPHGRHGIIDYVEQVGGWPTLNSLPAPTDTDGDGMPDEWELANGLNPNDPADASLLHKNRSGYTNIEVYINSLVKMPY